MNALAKQSVFFFQFSDIYTLVEVHDALKVVLEHHHADVHEKEKLVVVLEAEIEKVATKELNHQFNCSYFKEII